MHLKLAPYHVKHVEGFTTKALAFALGLPIYHQEELRDLACTVWCCFTGMRVEDVTGMTMDTIEEAPATAKDPRCIRAILKRTKTDPSGKGPISGRTFIVPCTCLIGLEDVSERAAFVRVLKKNPKCSCIDKCPYKILSDYLRACPTESSTSPLAAAPSLRFMRALTSRGNRTLTCNPLGINEVRLCAGRVNDRLPPDVKISHITGHSGRHTLGSIAMNSNAGEVLTAAATKHKDPKTLTGYVAKQPAVLMGAALHVGAAVKTFAAESGNLAGYASSGLAGTGAATAGHRAAGGFGAVPQIAHAFAHGFDDDRAVLLAPASSSGPSNASDKPGIITFRATHSSMRGPPVPFSQVESSSEDDETSENTTPAPDNKVSEEKKDEATSPPKKKEHSVTKVYNMHFNF